ncbi:MAG: NUDIX domain-containing protein [Chloroflexi bacterium]|nr:NUDIX domain-containing protein [Chloroflexota bacterium]
MTKEDMADELLDIVNDNDEVTGQAMRSVVHQRGLLHRGAHVFLFNEQGDLLIHKRSADRANSPSLWDCSVSEHVKAGESYHEAAIRGMREELGLEAGHITYQVKFQMEYGPNDFEISEIYEGKVDPGLVKFDPEEIAEIRFVNVKDLKAEIAQHEEQFCSWFVKIMRWYRA